MALVSMERYVGTVMHRMHMMGHNYAERVNQLVDSPPGQANVHIEEVEMEAVDRYDDWASDPLE